MEKVSVAIINYNGRNTVLKTIDSIYGMEGVGVHIQVIDDCSTDGSPEMIKNVYPFIPIHIRPYNIRKLNVLRKEAIERTNTRKLIITDNDILFDRRCLVELLKVMNQTEGIATCTPRLMYWNEPKKIYTAGTQIHYLGAAIGRYRGEIVEVMNQVPSMNSGGGILLLDRLKALKIDGFDEEYMSGWGDDGEFYQRLMLAGYKCLYVPTAIAYHEDKPFNHTRSYRVAGQIYNRWQFILTHYSGLTLILLAPVLVLYEFMQLVFLIFKGMLHLYAKSNIMVLKDILLFLKKRKDIQGLRVVSDRDVLSTGVIYVSPSLLKKNRLLRRSLKVTCDFFDLYWKLIKPFIP